MTGDQIKQIRKRLGMTQKNFVEELHIDGIDQARLSKIESGKMAAPESLAAELQLRGWTQDPTDGPEWMISHGEEGFDYVIRLHPPKFTARVLPDPTPGSFTDPVSGVTVGDFIWHNNEPDQAHAAELAAKACAVWEMYAIAEDG